MSIEGKSVKPPFTKSHLKTFGDFNREVELLTLDNSLITRNKTNEIIDHIVRGGLGNAKLIGWTYGAAEDRENEDESWLREKLFSTPSYGYEVYSKNHPKEWDNIQCGTEIWKISKKEWIIIGSIVLPSLSSLIGLIIKLIL